MVDRGLIFLAGKGGGGGGYSLHVRKKRICNQNDNLFIGQFLILCSRNCLTFNNLFQIFPLQPQLLPDCYLSSSSQNIDIQQQPQIYVQLF